LKPCVYPLEDLLPHAGPMVLLDQVVGHNDASLTAAVTVRPGRFFFVEGRGIPAHVAIEWMAQACGACVGAATLDKGRAVNIGLLLGTRNFAATVPWFSEDEELHVTVHQAYNDGEMGSFDCRVENSLTRATLATAQLMVYSPAEGNGLLEMQATGAA
jgi:predicted hotdog family 3-hydroxylacyl-ACP dehydratase